MQSGGGELIVLCAPRRYEWPIFMTLFLYFFPHGPNIKSAGLGEFSSAVLEAGVSRNFGASLRASLKPLIAIELCDVPEVSWVP